MEGGHHMTITIADGRGALWQWDTGRRLRVGSGVEQIHYQNRALGCSVDVDVGTDGTAIIPDELLQDCHTLTAYAYVTDDTGAYTMVQQDFAVHKRAKPAGYVYTPTDQMTLQTIQRQIGDLADLTTEAKDTLVAAINEVALMGGRMSLRVADGYIQYSTDSGSTWKNLIAVAELKGSDGITPHIGDNGNWYLGATDTGKPSRGDPGAPGIYYGTTPPTGDTHPVWIDPDGGPDDGGLLPAVTAADNGKVLRVVSGAWAAEDMPTGGTDMGITGATVGQIAKITAVDDSGKPTSWDAADMPSGGETWEIIDTIMLMPDVASYILTTVAGWRKIKLTIDKTYKNIGNGSCWLGVYTSNMKNARCVFDSMAVKQARTDAVVDVLGFYQLTMSYGNNSQITNSVVQSHKLAYTADITDASVLRLDVDATFAEAFDGTGKILVEGVRA